MKIELNNDISSFTFFFLSFPLSLSFFSSFFLLYYLVIGYVFNYTLFFIVVVIYSLSHVQLLQPHGLWPVRLLCPWDSPGKNTGVVAISFSRGSSRPTSLGPSITEWSRVCPPVIAKMDTCVAYNVNQK